MESSTTSNVIPFHLGIRCFGNNMNSYTLLFIHRGIRCFGNNMNSYTLLFIHDLDSWSIPRLRGFFNCKLPNSSALIFPLSKSFSL